MALRAAINIFINAIILINPLSMVGVYLNDFKLLYF